jgi:hypothetical protein
MRFIVALCAMPLRAYVIFGIIALSGVVSGCTKDQSALLRPETFVGEYVYYCEGSGDPHDPDRLTLKADGRYLLVHMPGGRPGSKEEGTWELILTGSEPRVGIGDRVYPIDITGGRVWLLIDGDLGHWYKKIDPLNK